MERLHEYITLREKQFSIRAMCRVLNVSESGYYHSLNRTRTPRPWQLLLVKIREILAEHHTAVVSKEDESPNIVNTMFSGF